MLIPAILLPDITKVKCRIIIRQLVKGILFLAVVVARSPHKAGGDEVVKYLRQGSVGGTFNLLSELVSCQTAFLLTESFDNLNVLVTVREERAI